MPAAAIPGYEHDRLRALEALQVLDTPAEFEFDALTQAAALLCDTPISLVSLVDRERQWFKSNVGLPGVCETPREMAFCAHAIGETGILEVGDAVLDARFSDNPLVTGEPGIRFYAGAPLRLSNGQTVGTLCVIDRQPRRLDDRQRSILALLAAAAVRSLENRRAARALADQEARFRALADTAPVGVFAALPDGRRIYTNARWQQIFELEPADSLGDAWQRRVLPDDLPRVLELEAASARAGREYAIDFRLQRTDGSVRSVQTSVRPLSDADGRVTSYVGSIIDITDRIRQQQALRRSEQFLSRVGSVAGVGGWELELSSGALTWSEQTCRIHGVEPDYQPQLATAIDFYAPEARPVIVAAVERAMLDGQGWDLELPFIRADGQPIWVRAVGHAEFADGKPVRVLGAFQDITERIGQRHALERANARVLLATGSGGIGIWEVDLATRALEWDDQMYVLYDHPREAGPPAYRSWAGWLHPDDREATERSVAAAIGGNDEPFDLEFRVVRSGRPMRHLRSTARLTRDAAGNALRVTGVTWDITESRQLQQALAEQRELLEVTLKSIADAVITTDASGRVEWLNPVAERITGWRSADARGRELPQVFRIVEHSTRTAIESPAATCLRLGREVSFAGQALLLTHDGVEYGIEESAAPMRNRHGELLGVVLVFRDVTEQRRISGEMTFRASHDALTGLVNRAEFETRLDASLRSAHERHVEHALLVLDLDQFKLVNDACGHAAGDQLLQQVSKLLAEVVRSRDTLARLGGDEFALILEHCNGEQAARVAQKICDRLDEFRFAHQERRFRIGVSIGLVTIDDRWTKVAALMQAADTACYSAKEAGRNRIHAWYDSDRAVRARHREMQWANRLTQALDDGRFVLYGQCIRDLAAPPTPAPAHVELLLRLVDEDGELVLPGAFMPAAERFDLASRIDRFVLDQALRLLARLPHDRAPDLLAINLSGRSVGDRAFHLHAIERLGIAGTAACRRLCFEITETVAVTNMADAAAFVEQVRRLGVRVALDDFGAGASSFGYLKTLGVDILKIDGQFIQDVVDDPLDEAAVRCFIDVARVVGMRTVAECVDRPLVLQRVSEMGIDFAQGWELHRPEPVETLFGLALGPIETSAAAAA